MPTSPQTTNRESPTPGNNPAQPVATDAQPATLPPGQKNKNPQAGRGKGSGPTRQNEEARNAGMRRSKRHRG